MLDIAVCFMKFFEHLITFFREKREHTALVCKRIVEDEKYVNLVLRIAIETDNPEYKNSIITAIGESEKRFAQRLRNNTALYKNE